MKLILEKEKNENIFIIRPVDCSLNDFLGFNVYLSKINRGYIKDNIAYIPIEGDINDIYNRIVKLVRRYNLELRFSDDVKKIVFDAESELKKFDEFSKKAYRIRNNDIDINELQDFEKVLSKKTFARTLKPYQLLSAYHLSFSQNACNFSVPGSGKTTTVLAAYEYLRNCEDCDKHVDNLVVIGPLSSFISWNREYEECYKTNPRTLEIKGGVQNSYIENELIREKIKYDIILISYGSLFGEKDIINRFLKNNKTMVVLDEAHRIKNTDGGVQSSAALDISKYAKSRVILTGTPAPNTYADLYNLYKFIWPNNNIIGYSLPQLFNMSKTDDDNRIKDLLNRISPFFIRIKKTDLKLPTPIFKKPKLISLSNKHRIIYDSIAEMAITKFNSAGISNSLKKSAGIRLRQAATNPHLLEKPLSDYYDFDQDENSGIEKLDDSLDVDSNIIKLIHEYVLSEVPNKFIKAKELIDKIIDAGEKIIVWCEFVGTCEDFSGYLHKNGIQNKILYGKTDPDERKIIVNTFNNPDNLDYSVVIANPHAVGESISLHNGCHNALYLEQGFNAGVYMQSKDRIHRVGLKDDDVITYYFMQAENTVDMTIYDRIIKKEEKMLKIIEKEEIPLISDNLDYEDDDSDDIKAIIRDYYEHRNKSI